MLVPNSAEYRQKNREWEKGHPARRAKYLQLVKYMNHLQEAGILEKALPEQPRIRVRKKVLRSPKRG